jgi:prepilin signal peptidase PulO-like enzyme (type II secretory pathway)
MPLLLALLTGLLGAVMGSFAGAQVWRLRARQLVQDKFAGEAYDKTEYKRLVSLTKHKTVDDRSQCLSCHHTLAWYDLLPIFSWLSTKGKCRYCRQAIGYFEPLVEIGTAVMFAVFTYIWVATYGMEPASLGILTLWLVALTMFVILFVYDLKWFLLPDVIMFPLIGLSVVITAAMVVFLQLGILTTLLSVFASVMILAGLYFILWFMSKGLWVGFGDVKLGIALGILLIDWKLALLTLFLANLIGTLIVLPGLLTGRLSRKAQVPFGPLLIIGFFVSLLAGTAIMDGYEAFSAWLSGVLLML